VAGVGIGRVRFALGDGATEQQAKRVHALLRDAGLLDDPKVIPDLLGVAEIAKMAGVTSAAVCQWADLPEPIVRLKQGRIWAAPDIERYLRARRGGDGA
jgi:hypothetical protein